MSIQVPFLRLFRHRADYLPVFAAGISSFSGTKAPTITMLPVTLTSPEGGKVSFMLNIDELNAAVATGSGLDISLPAIPPVGREETVAASDNLIPPPQPRLPAATTSVADHDYTATSNRIPGIDYPINNSLAEIQELGVPLELFLGDMPALLRVTDKAREAILKEEFVDFENLFQGDDQLLDIGLDFSTNRLTLKANRKKERSISWWCDRFDQFSSVYVTFHGLRIPNLHEKLLCHKRSVQRLASHCLGWGEYDSCFRFWKSKNKAASWGERHQEFWQNASLPPVPVTVIAQQQLPGFHPYNEQGFGKKSRFGFGNQNQGRKNIQRGPRVPIGFCFSFHRSGACQNNPCNFSHLCYKDGCGEPHPSFTCKGQGQVGQVSNTSPQAQTGVKPGSKVMGKRGLNG